MALTHSAVKMQNDDLMQRVIDLFQWQGAQVTVSMPNAHVTH
jgi:hypothetical protein